MKKITILLSSILISSIIYIEFNPTTFPLQPQSFKQEVVSDEQIETSQGLLDEALQKKLSGKKLQLDYEGLSDDLLEMSKVVALPDGQFLIGLNHTLYKVDNNLEVVWQYKPTWILWDFDVVEATELVYGSAGDNYMFILVLSTGKELFGNGRNGSAAYGQVKAYGKDMCLITDNNHGYRYDRGAEPSMPDGLTAWRGTAALWWKEIPPDAHLVVSGNRILALTKTINGFYVKEIQ